MKQKHKRKSLVTKISTAKELFQYVWRERLWWMIPLVVTLLIIGILLIFAQSSPMIPFLYTAF